MRRCFLVEIKRACFNRLFLAALIVGCLFAVWSACGAISSTLKDLPEVLMRRDELFYPFTPFSSLRQWIGIDFTHPATGLFFLLLPLLVALPFSWSLRDDRKTGYIVQEALRVGRPSYYISKGIATCLSGAAIALVPTILNFIICSLFLPFIYPEVSEVIYWGVFSDWLWSDVFYTYPVLYLLLSIAKIGAFGALWALFCSAISLFVPKRFTGLLVAYFVILVVEYLQTASLLPLITCSLSPIEYLRGGATAFHSDGWVILGEFLFFALAGISLYFVDSKRDY